MKRTISIWLLATSIIFAQNYVEVYKNFGIDKIKKIFDNKLQQRSYWENYLKDYNTTLGYYEKAKYLIIANKSNKTLELYHANGKGNINKIFTKTIITGKSGEKKKEGDLVTPVGAYKIILRFKPQNSFYGPVAFSLSYPNTFDKLQGRDGHGIWIHGYPLDHEKRPSMTKGCMVLKNDQLLDLNSTIDPTNSYVIIHEQELKPIKKDTIASILSFIYSWKYAWQYNKINKYLSFYAKEFKRFNGEDLKAFSKEKKAIFSRKEKKKIIFKDIMILPYPNLTDKKMYKILFYEKYRAKYYKYQGNKEIYIKIQNNRIKILVEK